MSALEHFGWFKMSAYVKNLRVENRGPLKTSVSRNTAFVDDSSYVNFIAGWP